jgi:hypothetical protein
MYPCSQQAFRHMQPSLEHVGPEAILGSTHLAASCGKTCQLQELAEMELTGMPRRRSCQSRLPHRCTAKTNPACAVTGRTLLRPQPQGKVFFLPASLNYLCLVHVIQSISFMIRTSTEVITSSRGVSGSGAGGKASTDRYCGPLWCSARQYFTWTFCLFVGGPHHKIHLIATYIVW